MDAARALVDRSALLLEAVRTDAPLVQCITNTVVQNVTANVLLALGASAAMVDVPTEAGPFARVAGGLLVNTGTPHAEPSTAALEAARAAAEHGTPWVLDPVAVGSLPVRTRLAADLLAIGPSIVRGNASEVLALAGASAGGRGVDSTAGTEDAFASATDTAWRLGGTIAVSGPVDLVVTPGTAVRIANGTELLTRVTGGGCALGAVMAAFAAVAGPDGRDDAAAAATIVYTVAAEHAARRARGPGTFLPAFLDRLADVTGDEVRADARVAVTAGAAA